VSTVEAAAIRLALVIESDPVAQRHLANLLARLGYDAFLAATPDAALDALAHNSFHLSLLDLNLDGADGTEVLRRLELQGGSPGPVIALVNGDVDRMEHAGRLGVEDFLHKPFSPEALENTVKSALSRTGDGWIRPAEDARNRLLREVSLVLDAVARAARGDASVLISGESGVGKDLVARALHALSGRRRGPFVKVNCAVAPGLLELELFGHPVDGRSGGGTPALGRLGAANNGTMLLDGVAKLPPALQNRLLEILYRGQLPPAAGRRATGTVNVRILATTNQPLERAVAEGRFREDLFARLTMVRIAVPPLRDRPEDIPALVDYFVQRYASQFHRDGFRLSSETLDRLRALPYPGNVRELEHLVKRMIVLGEPHVPRRELAAVQPARVATGRGVPALPAPARSTRLAMVEPPAPVRTPASAGALTLKQVGREAALAAERDAILSILAQTRWNRARAAKLLGISYRSLMYKMRDIMSDVVRPELAR
jgi:two-component system response regulator AtoC